MSQNQTEMDQNETKWPKIETNNETGIDRNESKKKKTMGPCVLKASAVEC